MIVKLYKKALKVRCRIGSLENKSADALAAVNVRCRIGSLESSIAATPRSRCVRCRIGSLERERRAQQALGRVRCRIGSLEAADTKEFCDFWKGLLAHLSKLLHEVESLRSTFLTSFLN
ncbi:hypothetical protein SAMN05421863_10168 [Nitrosomonas communis]|uniref:Uncharacterized protein n=1 Tax=Nitrosomonas communis TaxID=44574 RepID=A0A1I4NQI9_9PROT|nr:hypothetical protein SAMN05421863_10168 [Nitrosomonas communis]